MKKSVTINKKKNYEKIKKKVQCQNKKKKYSRQINEKTKFYRMLFNKKSIVEGKLLFLESLKRK